MKITAFVLLVFLHWGTANLLSQTHIHGTWRGAITILGTDLTIIVTFNEAGDTVSATIDIPQQGAAHLPLTNVRFDGELVYFELPAGPGLAVFDGMLRDDEIAGIFTQAGIRGTFSMRKTETQEGVVAYEPPLPYREENVYMYNEDVRLGCTLTLPFEEGIYPAVILITGSGAQDRDETIFGFKPFRILAQHLTATGIAVLRCDDRGVGESTGSVSESTSEELAEDVNVMFRSLQRRDDIDPRRIGLLGHSEGGMIAAMVAARQEDISFVISVAGPAVPGIDILKAQTTLIFKAMGMSDELTHQQLKLFDLVYSAVKTGKGWDKIESFLRELTAMQLREMTEEQRHAVGDTDLYLEQQTRMGMATFKTRWYQFFIQHNPAENWRRVRQPVLALFGELDLQVPPGINKEALKESLEYAGNADYTIEVIRGANHLFQKAYTGLPTEYPHLEKEFIDGFLHTIAAWLVERL